MSETQKSAAPVFTEEEVDMCLAEAAGNRQSFLHSKDFTYDSEDEELIEAAKKWDDLALKIAELAGLKESSKQCSECDNGIKWGDACLACLGTGLWPPMRNGERVYPKLRG